MKNAKKRAVFFDTSFFSEADIIDIKMFVSQSELENFIIDDIYTEIIEGFKSSDKEGLKYICHNNYLKKNFKQISFINCSKKNSYHDIFESKVIQIKSIPIYCSTYYRWLPFALEPFFLLNFERHMYYNFQLNSKDGNHNEEISKLMGQLTQDELANTLDGKFFDSKKLTKARKKKRKDYKNNELKLTDYKLCLGAFLYACGYQTSLIIISCDYDQMDIVENIYRSLINQYAINKIIKKRFNTISEETRFCIDKNELKTEIDNLLDMIHNKISKDEMIAVTFVFYDKVKKRCFDSAYYIPFELAGYFLLDKTNLDCYSLDYKTESNSQFRFMVDPTKDTKKLYFKVTPRLIPFYNGFIQNCQSICKYCAQETNNPIEISTFIKPDA